MKIARILLAMLFLSAAAAACGTRSTITGPDEPGGSKKLESPALGAGVG